MHEQEPGYVQMPDVAVTPDVWVDGVYHVEVDGIPAGNIQHRPCPSGLDPNRPYVHAFPLTCPPSDVHFRNTEEAAAALMEAMNTPDANTVTRLKAREMRYRKGNAQAAAKLRKAIAYADAAFKLTQIEAA